MSEYSNGFDQNADQTIKSHKSVSDFGSTQGQNSTERVYGKLVDRAPETMQDLIADQYSRDYIKALAQQDRKDQVKI